METAYTFRDHLRDADRHVSGARLCDDTELVRAEVHAARASLTRALALLPRPEDFDDAA